ncbi:hypothetical protein O181_016861 [Austropuccinia psidii MF-1]|uniref:Integrase catalytic domain-containing protein n=1 Tax=Austropuccinia psidii MF-1 TaxID=1389203 RepID=A0A9Q3GRG5_9BASI|nr:hypothetical protein [Austropuccinia psidii MF-1]
MNTNEQNNGLQKIVPILTDKNYLEWKLRMIICLKQRRLYQYCIEQCIPGHGVTQTPTLEAKDKKVTLNSEAQGNPDAIINVLHEANLKEEALSTDTTRALILKKDSFPSKLVHYCSNGKHNPLVTTHRPEKCWQLHPELKPKRQKKDKEKKVNFTIARALFTHEPRETNKSITIVLDTGASNHMFNNKSFFENLDTNHCTKVATGCDKFTLISQGKGLAKIVDCLGNLWLLPNSLDVPNLTTNLLALSSIAKNERRIRRTSSFFEIYLDENNKPSLICPITSGILENHIKLSHFHCLNTQIKENGDLWHKRLGHINNNNMMKLVKTTKISNICDECINGKITQLPFKQSFKVTNHILENIHLDLCAPFQTPSIADAKYFLIIIDQMSGFISTKFLKNKSDCFNHFHNFKISAKNTFTTKIKNILTDGGGEFINKSFKKICAK